MLEEINSVDWGGLEHAHGPADDVPGRLRALTSPDPGVRGHALDRLSETVFRQGARFEATRYVVPFLLELLADPGTADRHEIIDLLVALAIGYDEAWLPHGFPLAELRAQADGGEAVLRAAPRPTGGPDDPRVRYRRGLEPAERHRAEAYAELSAYRAVRAGVPLLCSLLADGCPRVRTAAAYALAWFPTEAGTSVPSLVRAAEADPEPAVTATALVTLGLLGPAPDPAAPPTGAEPAVHVEPALQAVHVEPALNLEPAVYVEPALDDARDVVQWAGAIALARLRGPDAGQRVADELIRWCRGAAGASPGSRVVVPFLGGDLAGYAARAVGQLGDAYRGAAFDALLARLPEVAGFEALPVVSEALRTAFPDGPAPSLAPFEELAERQRLLVRVLAGSPGTWTDEDDAPFVTFAQYVRAYGLPGSPDALRAYVG